MSWKDVPQKDHYYKITWMQLGSHIHCKLFSQPIDQRTWAKCGSFVLRAEEFASFRNRFPQMSFFEEES